MEHSALHTVSQTIKSEGTGKCICQGGHPTSAQRWARENNFPLEAVWSMSQHLGVRTLFTVSSPTLVHTHHSTMVVRAHQRQCRPSAPWHTGTLSCTSNLTRQYEKETGFMKMLKILPTSHPPNNKNPASPRD